MKAIKKIASLILAPCLALGLAACSAQDSGAEPKSAETAGAQSQTAEQEGEEARLSDPLTASQIEPGSYEIDVESSSSMFNVVKCVLNVEGDTMYAVMTMSGDGYGMVFAGTGEEAAVASEADYIQRVLDSEGAVTFAIPVEELNAPMDCAAWSIRKEKWYDRTLVFLSDSIPEGALRTE